MLPHSIVPISTQNGSVHCPPTEAGDPDLAALEAQVKQQLSISGAEPLLWTRLYDMLSCMAANGLPMPEGYTPALFNTIQKQVSEEKGW
jgi:hypothetical protein